MQSDIAQLRAGQDQLRADIAQIRTDTAALRLGQELLRADIDRIRAEVASIRADLDGIRADVDGVRAEVASIRADQASLRAHVDRVRADVMDRIDRLQTALTDVVGDIRVNFASSDHALRIAKAAQDSVNGLHEIISAMRQRIALLQSQIDQLRDNGKAA